MPDVDLGPDYGPDWLHPFRPFYDQPPIDRSGAMGFSPDADAAQTWQDVPPEAFKPAPPVPDAKVKKSSAQALSSPPSMPPPGAEIPPPPYVSANQPSAPPQPLTPAEAPAQLQQPAPEPDPIQQQIQQTAQRMADRQKNIPQQIGQRPQDIDPNTGKVKTGAKVESWAQRIGMALLAATKLAPYAQQIIHSQWTQEMGAYQAGQKSDEAQLEALTKAQESQSRSAYETSEAKALDSQGRLRPIPLKDGSLYDPASHQVINNPKTLQELMAEYKAIGFDDERARLLASGVKTLGANDEIDLDPAQLPGPLKGLIVPGPDGKIHATPTMVDSLARSLIKEPTGAANRVLSPDEIAQYNAASEQEWHVLHPEPMPDTYKLKSGATEQNYKDIVGQLKATEGAIGTKAQRDAVNAQNDKKADVATKKEGMTAFTPAMEAAERFNIMTGNYESALKGDQQAMVSLLMNHIGMTLGAQKGGRITKDVIHEAAQSLPWLDRVAARFDPNTGLLSGIALAPGQMRQMVNLGRERFAQEISKARNTANYMGVQDDGPKRTPNQATKNYYKALAGGDMTKAVQLAAQDGWSL